MKDLYNKNTNTCTGSVQSCIFEVLWCTKYRRPVLTDGVEVRLGELVTGICEELDIQLIDMQIEESYIRLKVSLDPRLGVYRAVKKIKAHTFRVLKEEYPRLKSRIPSLWTNNYYVRTLEGHPETEIEQYLKEQRKN